MYDCLMVLIDESDLIPKDQALAGLALLMAQYEAIHGGACNPADAAAYAAYVFPRSDELLAKLRQVIDTGAP